MFTISAKIFYATYAILIIFPFWYRSLPSMCLRQATMGKFYICFDQIVSSWADCVLSLFIFHEICVQSFGFPFIFRDNFCSVFVWNTQSFRVNTTSMLLASYLNALCIHEVYVFARWCVCVRLFVFLKGNWNRSENIATLPNNVM